jgi:hypothetical protein
MMPPGLAGGGPNFDLDGAAATPAAFSEPFAEGHRESGGGHAKSGFEETIGQRKRVIKLRGTGKIAHAKCVQPIERTGPLLAADDHIHEKSLSVHFRAFQYITGDSRAV